MWQFTEEWFYDDFRQKFILLSLLLSVKYSIIEIVDFLLLFNNKCELQYA